MSPFDSVDNYQHFSKNTRDCQKIRSFVGVMSVSLKSLRSNFKGQGTENSNGSIDSLKSSKTER